MTYSFPRNGLDDRTGEQRYRAVRNRSDYHVGLARTGQCPFCAGAVETDLDSGEIENADPPVVRMACETCSIKPLRFVPRVAAALVAPDVDLRMIGPGPFVSLSGTVRSRSPLRVAFTVEATGGTATIVVDGSLDVCAVSVETAE